MNDDLLSPRLNRLERQLTFWRVLTVLSFTICAVTTATRLAADTQWIKATRVDATAVVAREFDIVNASGRVTARFAPEPDHPDFPRFVLKYPNDKAAVDIGVNGEGFATISLLNSEGAPRAMMTENADGPGLTLFDENARIRIEVDALKPGPQISIYDRNRKRTVVAFSN